MRRNHRFLTAVFTVIALLFTQLAVAAYACPMEQQAAAPMQGPCDMQPSVDAGLCTSHCEEAVATLGTWKGDAAFAQAVDSGARVPALRPRAPAIRVRAVVIRAVAAPPPLARFTVLRI